MNEICAICGETTTKHRLVCKRCQSGILPDGARLPDDWQDEEWAKTLIQKEKDYRNMKRRDHRHGMYTYSRTYTSVTGTKGDKLTVDGHYAIDNYEAESVFHSPENEFGYALGNILAWYDLENRIRPLLKPKELAVFDICVSLGQSPYFDFKKIPIAEICKHLNIGEEAAYKRVQRLRKKINDLLQVKLQKPKNVQIED